MGLLLSVFVVFVSVVELLTVFSDFQRRLQPVNSDRDFSPLIRRYEAGLHKERQRILKILDEHRKLKKIAECQTEGAPSTSQPDAHQSTTSHFGRKLKEDVLSRSPSPAIPAVPRNSFSIESTEDQHDSCKDEPNHICPPEEVVEGTNEDKLRILSRNISKDDSFEKITNALNELVSSKSNIEENVLLHEIAPNVSTVSIKEDALEVASKSEIVTKRKKEEIEIRKLCFEKKLLSVECPSKITSHNGNLDIIVYDDEVSNNKDKIILKEDAINVMPEHNGLEIAQQKGSEYDVDKIASNEDVDTGKGGDIQPHTFKTEEKVVSKEDSFNILAEHNLEVVSDTKVSDITQKQIPLNDEEIVPKGSSLDTVSEHNVEINNDSLQIISEHIDKTDKNNDTQHQLFKIEKEDPLVIIAEHDNLEINSEESRTVQQQGNNNENGAVSAEIVPEHINLNEKCDNIQQQVFKTKNEQIISKEDSVNIVSEHNNLEMNNVEKCEIIQQLKNENEEVISKEAPFQIISEHIDNTNKADDIKQQVSKNEKPEIVSKEDHLDIIPDPNNLKIIKDSKNDDVIQLQLFTNDEEAVLLEEDSLQNIPDKERNDSIQQQVCNTEEERIVPKEDSLHIVSERVQQSVPEEAILEPQKTKVVQQDSLQTIPGYNNDSERSGSIQQQVCSTEEERVISKDDSLNISSEHNENDVLQQKMPVSSEKEVVLQESPINIISEYNNLEIIHDAQQSKVVQHELPQKDDEKLVSENSLQAISEHKTDTEKSDTIQQTEDERVLSKEDFPDIISECIVQQEVPENSEKIILNQQEVSQKEDEKLILKGEVLQAIPEHKNDSIQQEVCKTEEERVTPQEDSLENKSEHLLCDVQLKVPSSGDHEVSVEKSSVRIISEHNNLEIISDAQESKIIQEEVPQKDNKEIIPKEEPLQIIPEHRDDPYKGSNTQQQVCKTEEEPVITKTDSLNIIFEQNVSDIVQQKVPENSEKVTPINIISEHNVLEVIGDVQAVKVVQQEASRKEDEIFISKAEPLQAIPEPTNGTDKSDDIQQRVCKTVEESVITKEDSLNIISEQYVSDIVQQEVPENSEEVSSINITSELNNLEISCNTENIMVVPQELSSKVAEKLILKDDSLQTTSEHKNDTEKSDCIQQEACKTEAEQVIVKADSLNLVYNRSDIVQQKVPENSEKVNLGEGSINIIPEHNNLPIIGDDQVKKIAQKNDEKLISKEEDTSKGTPEHRNNIETSDRIQQEVCKTEGELVMAKEDSADIISEHHTNDVMQQKVPANSEEIILETTLVNIISEQNNLEIISDVQEDKVILQQVFQKVDEKSISEEELLQTIPEHKNNTEKKSDSIQQEVCKTETEQAKEDSLNIIPKHDSSDTVQLKVPENGEEQIIPKEDSLDIISNEGCLQSALEHIDNAKGSNSIPQQVLNTEEIVLTDNGDITQQTNNAENIPEKLPPEEPSKTNDKNIPKKAKMNIKKCPLEITRVEGVKLHSITFDSVDYWPNKASIGKKKGKSKDKGSKKRVKFGLHVQELEPEWSRAPSPIFKLINSPSGSEVHSPPPEEPRVVNLESLQITELSRQIVTEDYWRRSPSPFRDLLEPSTTAQIVSEVEDHKESSLHLLRELEKPEVISWDPNRKILSSDEETEIPFSLDEEFINTLDGLKPSRLEEKRKSRRRQGRKSTKQNSLESDSKTNNSGISESSLLETEVAETSTNKISSGESKSIRKVEKKKLPVEDRLRKQDNSASSAFWLIFSGEYTKAMNKDWHGQHFCCWQCDESLTGQRYVLREEHPYCVACYESVFANSCEKCSRTIGIDSKDLSYKDKHWHEACFLCATCGDSLVDKQFGSKGDRIYCGRCYDEQFASRCDGCGQIFRAGTKKMEYKTRQWHEKCFCCCVCKTPIGTQSFIPREQEIYCAKCYEEKYATRCIKCNKVITSGGVTYKNEPWHRECFTCTHCNTSLAGARFTSRDDKPYCAECFGELFAKRCTACNKPITGIGGTKFISFEDRHWHNDCFFCASCRTSLVGRGFITDGDDIICPECAKQKLM